MRDKLLAELLMNQIGESEWKQLSEKERQRKLIELKLKEKQLRRDGNGGSDWIILKIIGRMNDLYVSIRSEKI